MSPHTRPYIRTCTAVFGLKSFGRRARVFSLLELSACLPWLPSSGLLAPAALERATFTGPGVTLGRARDVPAQSHFLLNVFLLVAVPNIIPEECWADKSVFFLTLVAAVPALGPASRLLRVHRTLLEQRAPKGLRHSAHPLCLTAWSTPHPWCA